MLQGDIKLGKFKIPKAGLVIGGAVAIGIVGYAYYVRGGAAGATGEEGTDDGNPNIDPSTGLPYDSGYGYGVGSGLGIYDPSTGSIFGSGYGQQIVQQVSTNAAWSQAAALTLEQKGYEGTAVAAALGKALMGVPMTQEELNIFNAARGFHGEPPNGYPPIRMVTATPKPPAPKPPGSKPPPALKAPTGLRAVNVYRNSFRMDWNPVPGAEGYTLFLNGRRITSVQYSVFTFSGVSRNKSYTVTVRPNRDGKLGPAASRTVRTKK